MHDMNPDDIVGDYREHTLTFQDGSSRHILVTDIESPYPDGRLIVSRTDPAGIITQVNHSFVEMAVYSEDELLGQPHHILRHPDMPPAAFKDLWDTVQKGEKWHGYVKNLRKDGGFYWVLATVIPNVRNGKITGYTSVRRKPARRKVEECIKTYPTLF
ncbi:MAG: PAS domain-containing protein [Candidatus Thiodiazotropha sp. (ex. Lucinisca nassula)]|uniref:PAS domain-containing protein n=1 Tax=Candidatus Thiodiazotropha sp. LNASS1 TaxID=3096260 RepID=UPI000D3D21F2|nr:PAS domain-containing protein [Candidatus Thiodiazotropha sp. (ex. Lucinisca nassula)]MBW9274134.1 PAS domain-containing protein [Candidatus Thiodiazotropha sp. (ex. Lucinisca nassula)]PUB81772.1 MAG: diguanylate cyclase [gamma proteobacterium symbiont of Ctena orbiculata]PUB88524.1 MAG: diguanylate cyclase [gamma proteobacterium symbiont of Ctena orbiculata]